MVSIKMLVLFGHQALVEVLFVLSMMARPGNGAGAQLAIFNTPELLSLIFNASLLIDCARLASASRTIFNAAASVLWKDLNGAEPLLRLLQATSTIDGAVTVFKVR